MYEDLKADNFCTSLTFIYELYHYLPTINKSQFVYLMIFISYQFKQIDQWESLQKYKYFGNFKIPS